MLKMCMEEIAESFLIYNLSSEQLIEWTYLSDEYRLAIHHFWETGSQKAIRLIR